MKKTTLRRPVVVCFRLAIVTLVTSLPLDLWPARAASETWTGSATTGNWTDATWSPDATAPGTTSGTTNTDTATFGSSGASTITVDTYRNLQNITFNGLTGLIFLSHLE